MFSPLSPISSDSPTWKFSNSSILGIFMEALLLKQCAFFICLSKSGIYFSLSWIRAGLETSLANRSDVWFSSLGFKRTCLLLLSYSSNKAAATCRNTGWLSRGSEINLMDSTRYVSEAHLDYPTLVKMSHNYSCMTHPRRVQKNGSVVSNQNLQLPELWALKNGDVKPWADIILKVYNFLI